MIKEKVDSILIIISSHGVNGGIDLIEGDCINVVEELMIPFSDTNFPEYQGKPKIFMPLVCQYLSGLESENSMHLSELDHQNHLFDMLICYPALPGFAHNRMRNQGTLYVNLLMYNLMKYARSLHFVQILDKVMCSCLIVKVICSIRFN